MKTSSKPGYGPLFWFLWCAHIAALCILFSAPKITLNNIGYAVVSGVSVYAYLFINWVRRGRSAIRKQEQFRKILAEHPISVPMPQIPSIRDADAIAVKTHRVVLQDAVQVYPPVPEPGNAPPDWNEATQGPYVPFNVNNKRPTGREPAANVKDALNKLDDFFGPK